jgi:hypothetical protein
MDLTDDATRAELRRRLGELFADRPVICGIAPLAGFVDWVRLLQEVGARRPLLVATGLGAGLTPAPEEAEVVFLDVPQHTTMTDDLRRQDALARSLPAHVRAAVEAYDERGDALWMVGPFIGTEPVLGREVVGGRPLSWTALEDKLVVDAIWDEVGFPRAPSRIVPCEPDALAEASRLLDRGVGTVWAGDARDGFNGGGDYVRHVDEPADAERAIRFFAPRCDRVRVMPFLDGVPCSIHGMVLADGVAAFRPVELAILRGPERRFAYGGQGTGWDPPAADRAAMRRLVRDVGELLRAKVGYRGAFGIDGVLTADGFRPTELNPRMSAGISSLARVADTGLFTLLQFNLAVGRDPGVGVAELESWALPLMDEHRFARAIALAPVQVGEAPQEIPVCWEDGVLRRATDPSGWTVSLGPNPSGTYTRLMTPPGAEVPTRAAELNVALMRFLDAEFGTGFGDVTMAPDVRAGQAANVEAGPAPTE